MSKFLQTRNFVFATKKRLFFSLIIHFLTTKKTKKIKCLWPPDWPHFWPPAIPETDLFLGWPKCDMYWRGIDDS